MSKVSTGLISTAVSGLVLAAGVSVSTPASAVDLLINNYLPPKHPFQVAVTVPWIEDVIKATNGSVNPKLSDAAVGPPPKNWQTVSKGVADVVLMANLFQRKRLELPKVAEFPLSSPSAQGTSRALWATHEKFFAKANEYKGNHLVASFALTPSILHSRGKALTSLESLKGVKVRSSPGALTKIIAALGATPVASSPLKIFSLVSKGVVDAAAVPAHALRAFRIMPHIKATTLVPGGIANVSFSLLINGKKWDGLSKKQQEQVMSVSGMHVSDRMDRTDKIAASALKGLQKAGGKLVQADAGFMAALKKLAVQNEADWLKAAAGRGIDGPAALAFFKAEAAK